MNLGILGGFLVGNASAIRQAATDRAALWTGIMLVLMTGIARNYDQSYLLASPLGLIGPLVFSFFSGSFLHAVLIGGIARRHFPEEGQKESRWVTFMTLFWMTAPIAWLYAIPVERFFDSYRAAQANIALLGIVSVWRVLLMSRIMAVLFEISFVRALGWVLIAASAEVIVVLFFGAFFSGTFSQRLLASMAGMRNSPEESLLISILSAAWGWSWAVLVGSIILLVMRPLRQEIPPLPILSSGKAPWFSLMAFCFVWALVAIEPQREQHRFAKHAALVGKGEYVGALAYLEKHERRDFPPGRRLEPNPYEYRVWRDLPPTIALLTSETAPWIRRVYLDHLTATLSHHYPQYESLTNVAAMWGAIERLPEGRNWLSTNQAAVARQGLEIRHDRSESEFALQTNILSILKRMGMAETNLTQLKE
ncbi:MAG: hypothetical protein AB1813_26985 [Verrucomicrobiota bacterium]